MKKKLKVKKGAWFVKLRGSYLPRTWQAWVLYVPYVTFLVGTIVVADDGNQSRLSQLLTIVTQWAVAAMLMTWIASKKS
jgi:hypothetical protein